MGRLNLAVLGTPEVRHPEQLLRFPSRKALALLIYLAVEGGVQTREKLTTLFWPESDETRSKGALRRTLVYLRNTLQEEVAPSPLSHLIIERDTLVFNVASAFQMDVHELQLAFKDVCSSSRPGDLQGEARSTLLAHFQDAVEQYRADFLEGFSLDDAPDFDDWTRLQREVWHQRMSAVFDHLSQMQFEGGELPAALETARRWIRHDPLHETAYRRLIQVQFTRGERTAALQTYETCRLMLAKELRTKPAPETEALVARLRAQLLPQGETSWSLPSSAPHAASVPSPLSLLANVPLVGRASEYGTLIEVYAAAQSGHPQVVLLKGEAGIGKTRLAQDFLGWARAEGADVLQGRAFETGGLLPYQAIVEALRSRLERENAPDDLLADVWLTELSRILPELRERYPDLVPPAGDETTARIRLFEAVACLGQALAARAPLVLFIDDLQWADTASLDVLHYAGRRWMEVGVPMLLLLSLRAETMRPTQALATWLAGLERNLPVTSLLLGALTTEDTLQLVQGLGGELRSQRSREMLSNGKTPWSATRMSSSPIVEAFGSFLFAESGGQPFYVLELLKVVLERGLLAPSLQEDGRWGIDFEEAASQVATLRGVLPPGVRDVIRTRLGRLTPSALTLLIAGAVLGQRSTYELLCRVADLGEQDGLVALEEVLAAQVLREEQQEDRPSFNTTYGFTHDKIRDVVYTEAGDARRHIFHRRALEVLQARAAPAAQLAHHARAGGLLEPAFRWSLAAGDEAWRLFANVLAKRHYAEALESLAQLPDTAANRRHRVDTVLKKALIGSFSDPPEQTLALLAEAETLVRAGLPVEESEHSARLSLAHIHFLMGRIHNHRNDRQQAVQYFQRARAGAHEGEDEGLEAAASCMIGRVLATQGYCGQARPLLTQALLPLERAANWIEYLLTLGYLGDVLAACGEYREGLLLVQRALALAQERGDLAAIPFGYLHLALAYFFGGERELALEESRAVVRRAEQAGDWVRASIGYGLRAWAENQLGQHEVALASMAQQQALARSLGEQRLILADWFAATSAEIVLSAHRVEEALTLAEAAVVYAYSVDGKYAEGLAQRVWGQALAALTSPRWEEAEEHLTTSLQAFEACEMLPEIARTHRTWGLLCRDRHDLASARAHLEKAATIFEACGLTDEQERTRRMVTHSG
jgi:DNA-binding SARP family transcriptional activator